MQTTAILAELLVIGSVSLLWFVSIIQSIINFNYSDLLENTTGIIISLAILYILGIIVNFLSDRLFSFYSNIQADKNGGKYSYQIARTKILLTTPEAVSYMAMRRSILRIMRASTFNFVLYAIVVFIGISDHTVTLNNLCYGLILLLIAIVFFWGYNHTLDGYFKYLKMTEKLIDEKSKQN